MQFIGAVDPNLTSNGIDAGPAANGGKVILHNLSQYDLQLYFGQSKQDGRRGFLPAWAPREFDFCGKATPFIFFDFIEKVTNTTQQNAPSSVILGESYAKGEAVPVIHPNYDRLSNLGNNVSVNNVPAIVNENNPPAYPIVQAGPTDQNSPAVVMYNDGSMAWSILSAGVLRNVLNVVRGTLETTEAQIIIGDANDTSMLILHGTADNSITAGIAQTADVAQSANTINVFDSGLGQERQVSHYIGTVDPSTYLTPNEGDIWFDG